jgi:hypothetical protein
MHIDWNAQLNAVMLVVLPLLAADLFVVGANQVKSLWEKFHTKDPSDADTIAKGAQIAVKYAEQIWVNSGFQTAAQDKKKAAIDYLQKWLADRRVKVDVNVLDGAIESAVFECFNAWKAANHSVPSQIPSYGNTLTDPGNQPNQLGELPANPAPAPSAG